MTPRQKKLMAAILGSVAGLVLVLIVAGIWISQTNWFRDFVRQKIVQTVEDSTGGRVEVGRFDFDWRHLRAEIQKFVLHGTESPSEQPLFQAQSLTVVLKFLSLADRKAVDIASLDVKQPQANLIVYPDGRTNVPQPKVRRQSDKSALDTVVDLAIGRFSLQDGSVRVADQKIPFSARGQNLTVQLRYEMVPQQYRGQITMDPLFVQYAENRQGNVKVDLNVILGKDRIELPSATMATPNSSVQVSGTLEHLSSPNVSARVSSHIDLVEMKQILGKLLPLSIPSGSPRVLEAAIDASLDQQALKLASARITLGKSTIEASGNFRNTKLEDGTAQFRADLVLAELARILDPSLNASGQIEIGGQARINGPSEYRVNAALSARDVSVQRGSVNLSNINLSSRIAADPRVIDLDPIALRIGPGEVRGNAELRNMAQYRANLNLSRLNLQDLLSQVTSRRVGYAAVLSGPLAATGNLKRSDSLKATARLNITPGGRGVPVSGSLNADYDAPGNTVIVRNSFIALPASRLDVSGTLGTQLDVHLVSRNLEDFRPAMSLMSNPPAQMPVQIESGGSARIDATMAGQLRNPSISAQLAVNRFRVDQRHFDQLAMNLNASSSRAAVASASLQRGSLAANFQGSVGLDRWSLKPNAPLTASATIQNGDLQDLLAFAGKSSLPLSGQLTMDANVSGTVGDPQGSARLRVANGMAYGEPLNLIQGEIDYGAQQIKIPSLQVISGDARANLRATFQHPPEKFSEGTIQVHLDTNQVALSRLQAIQARGADLDGNVQMNLDAQLALNPAAGSPGIQLVSANGNVGARGLRRQGRSLGDLAATIQTSGSKLDFRLTSDFAGSKIDATGETDLSRNYETTASLNVQALPIPELAALAGKQELASRGLLSLRGDVSGTLRDPRANLDINLTNAVLDRQTVDRLSAHLTYSSVLAELDNAVVQMGPSRVNFSGSFSHPANDFSRGDLRVRAESTPIQLSQIAYAQQWKPGIGGTAQLFLDAAAKLEPPGTASRVALSNLNAHASVSALRVANRDFGGFTLNATGTGSSVTASLDSNVAQSSIKASLRGDLTGDYPVSGQLTFSGIRYANLAGLIRREEGQANFDTLIEGTASFSGPALKPENLTGNLDLTKAEFYTAALAQGGGNTPVLALQNDGPISVAANRSGVQIKQARWTGPSSQLALSGSVALRPLAFNVDVNANADLQLLHQIREDISSAGNIQVNASVKGQPSAPQVTGRVELNDVAFQTSSMPNGISKANGVIMLAGTTATIQSLTAESGGGRVNIDGTFTRFGGNMSYNLGLRANRVDVRTESGASVGVNANLKLNGTQRSGVLSGSVTIRQVKFTPRTDLGTMLASTANPPTTPSVSTGFLATTRLDVSVKTAPAASFESVYTTSLDASADLTARGTLANPGMLGRVTISSGEVVFFGTKYTLNSGTISFFNPTRIEPILDVNLETTARGVQVTLNVTGPADRLNLAYQSDPPLQFSEIVSLLAAGKMPTSDPVLLAHQPPTPAQSFQQMGESAILNKAVASPVAGQLKRVFGVSELKIDPTFTSGSALPQARLTLQQKVTQQLTFTYITDVTQADSQILRAEWALNPRWSAVATREINGLVSIDLFYKRRFR
jgi:translocation and assembly module TamB